MTDYNTALGEPPGLTYPAVPRFEGKHGVAFEYDLTFGIPAEMERNADVLYSDLPWRDGYIRFADRAGKQQLQPYKNFLGVVGRTIRIVRKPAVIVTGKHALPYLMPDTYHACTLNGGAAIAAIWHRRLMSEETAEAIIERLAQEYDCIGDPCCGYGRAGRVFAQHGKRYVMSDIDPHCIGYISTQEWA